MEAKSRFFDDMHPRTFPNEKKQLFSKKTPGLLPKPTLPGVSMIVDKNQLTKAAPKKSFHKWKQQHEALFEPKLFQTTNRSTTFVKQKNVVPQQITFAANSKFELDFQKNVPIQQETHEEYQHFEQDCNKFKNNFPLSGKKPQFQSMMAFSQLNRVARSEATRCTVPLVGQHKSNPIEDHQSNTCGCQCVAVASSNDIQNSDLDNNNEGTHSNLQVIDSSMEKAVVPKRPLTNKALANIVEEQIEIVEQQKQILKQQNEIFNLQYQIEKLLLMNNGLKNISPNKKLQSSPICKSITGSPNALPIENGASPKARKSIGVMTSFQCDLNEACSPDRNQNLASLENHSPKDTMLERINNIIKNSPPMMNYKMNNGTNNCRVSPIRADINFSSQTLIYKASTRNNISINDPKVADRSFALHLLDMKYHPDTPTSSNNQYARQDSNEKAKRGSPSSKSTDNDFVSSNISPDKYDYLIRHGLLKK